MKQLPVPHYTQDDGSADCGPVCVRMVLAHFGIERSVDELRANLTYGASGTSSYQNGTLLLHEGLTVRAVTAQPLLFSPDTIPALTTNEAIAEVVRAYKERRKGEGHIPDTMLEFMTAGGTMELAIPSFQHVKEAIDGGSLVIALMHAKALGSHEGSFHFVVVNGYDEDRVFITNPPPRSRGQAWFPVADFLYGVHASTTTEVDNGTLLVVGKG